MSAAQTAPESSIDRLINALVLHRAGRLAEAEAGYRGVLADEPDHATALRLLGLLLLGSGHAEAAVAVLRDAVAAEPNDADARTALADATAAAGDRPAAISLYRDVLTQWPGNHAARVNFANTLRDAGEVTAAIAECRLALATAPRLVAAHITLGSALLEAGRVVEAIGAYRTAVTLEGASPVALAGLAMALLRDRRGVDSLEAALRATRFGPHLAEAWFVRGVAEHALAYHVAAQGSLERAVAADPGHARARLALGNVLADLDDFAAAEAEIGRAIGCSPTLPEAHASLGYVLSAAGRPTEAAAACSEAIRLRPGFARAYWNRSTAHLLAGNYAQGWPDYEWRRQDVQFAAGFPDLPGWLWTGEDLAGKSLLVWAEQGLGDSIQFARYLPLLAARGARVVLACPAPLMRLMQTIPGVASVVTQDATLPHCDFHVFLMSLPLQFGTTLDSIPAAGGYLQATSTAHRNGRRRVGLVWAGNPDQTNDARRSIPTAALAPLADLAGIEWENLQVGGRGPELAIMHRMPAPLIGLTDLAATAERIAGLDLVISADTAVAHLAGAMGKPVWILLSHAADWRWLLGREDSPWYGSARLIRQSRRGDWDGVIARVARDLASF